MKAKLDEAYSHLSLAEQFSYHNPFGAYIYAHDVRFAGGQTPTEVIQLEARIATIEERIERRKTRLRVMEGMKLRCAKLQEEVRAVLLATYRCLGSTHDGQRRLDRVLEAIQKESKAHGDQRFPVLVRLNQMLLNSPRYFTGSGLPNGNIDRDGLRKLLLAYLDGGPQAAYGYLEGLVTPEDRLKAQFYPEEPPLFSEALRGDLTDFLTTEATDGQVLIACARS